MQTGNGAQYFGVGLDLTQLRQGAAEARNLLHGIGQQAANEGSQMDAVFSKMRNTVAGVFAADKVREFIGQVISTRAEIQSLSISFETLLGSKEKAAEMFGDIRKFATATPMMLKDLAGGAQTMLAFNIEAEKVMPMLRAIGDISMGDAQKFTSLTLAFSQMSATGKLMGQDLLQMINAGFNPLAIISEKTGKSIGELKKDMEAGNITTKMVEDAFLSATSAGGKFYGMLEKQSQGLAGAQAKLSGAIDDMFNSMGESAEGVVVSTLNGTAKIAEHYKTIGEILMVIVASYGAYKAALIAVNAIEAIRYQMTLAQMAGLTKMGAITEILTAKTKSLTAAMLANPWGLAAAAVVALGYGIYKLVTYQTDAEKAQERLNKVNEDFNATCASERVQIDTLFARLRSAKKGTEEYKEAKDAILGQYGNYLNGLSAEIASLQDVEAAYKAIKTAALDAARARAMEAATKGEADTYAAVEAEQLKKLKEAMEAKYGNRKLKGSGMLASVYYFEQVKKIIQDGGDINTINPAWLKEWDVRVQGMSDAMGEHYSTSNKLKEIMNRVAGARKILNDTIAKAQEQYGAAMDVEPTKDNKPKATEASIRAELKVQEKKLAQLRAKKASIEDQAEVQKRIDALEKQLKDAGIDVNKENRTGIQQANTAQDNKDKLAKEASVRIKAEEDYARQTADAAIKSELDIEQARIDAMQDGLDKTLAQNKLNYKRIKEQRRLEERDLLDNYAEHLLRQEETANPTMFMKKDSKGKLEDDPGKRDEWLRNKRASLTVNDLPDTQKNPLLAAYAIQDKAFADTNKKALEEALTDVQTYAQKREKILRDYKRREEELYEGNRNKDTGEYEFKLDADGNKQLRHGVSQGNVDELSRQRDEAVANVDQEFASRNAEFESWCNQIADWSLDKLNETLTQAEAQLAALEKANPADPKLATVRAQIQTMSKQIDRKSQEDKANPGKRAVKEWKDLHSTLTDVVDIFNSLGEVVGGTAGEIIKGCGGIANTTLSMVDKIVNVVTVSSAAMTATSAAGAASIKTMESASVILVVISAALQIATQIASMFDSDKVKQKEIQNLQERIDQLQWEIDNAETVRMQRLTQTGNFLKEVQSTYEDIRYEMYLTAKAAGDATRAQQLLLAPKEDAELLRRSVERITETMTDLDYTAGKALGQDKYKAAREELDKYAQQMVLTYQEIQDEQSRGKKKDEAHIRELEHATEESAAKMRELLNGVFEDIMGGSVESIANDLANAFFDAFAAGEDAAQAWGDKVNDIVGSVVKRMLVSKLLEKPMGAIFDKYMKLIMPDGELSLNKLQDVLPSLANELGATAGGFQQAINMLPYEIKKYLLDSDMTREAATEGIATASQESVDELNGRMTAVQSHTYSIAEQTKRLVENSTAILMSVMNIETNTTDISTSMVDMRTDLRDVRATISDIQRNGLRMTK